MTITVDLDPELEYKLRAYAQAQGLTLLDYVERLLEQHAQGDRPSSAPKADTLVQFFRASPLVGLELEFERDCDLGRDVEL